jgi:hypothetical protein
MGWVGHGCVRYDDDIHCEGIHAYYPGSRSLRRDCPGSTVRVECGDSAPTFYNQESFGKWDCSVRKLSGWHHLSHRLSTNGTECGLWMGYQNDSLSCLFHVRNLDISLEAKGRAQNDEKVARFGGGTNPCALLIISRPC